MSVFGFHKASYGLHVCRLQPWSWRVQCLSFYIFKNPAGYLPPVNAHIYVRIQFSQIYVHMIALLRARPQPVASGGNRDEGNYTDLDSLFVCLMEFCRITAEKCFSSALLQKKREGTDLPNRKFVDWQPGIRSKNMQKTLVILAAEMFSRGNESLFKH